MNILKTCLKAGHRWGVPTGFRKGDRGFQIVRCQRAGCRRMRYHGNAFGRMEAFTYTLGPAGETLDQRGVKLPAN